ncbi:histidine phosphatase family protein [Paenibacillus chibensis]|uniref:Histidine phosphatase family protein n=1 Tax=Paenibacillus chibensis TaxID=59846 RepID=A0ABU6PPC7_9BACL|nr:histidine phosphatase family protein [Paenibacillus chibensis]
MGTMFYLVRHAIKAKAAGDVSITPQGVLQAEATALRLTGLPITAIFASPLQRAQETAKMISAYTKASLTVEHRLRERANWGDLPGQSFDEFVEMWERSTRDPDYIPPVGDTAKQAGLRLAGFMAELAGSFPQGSHLVLVTHGGLITDFLVNALSEQELNAWHPTFVASQSELISECSITTLTYDGGVFQLVDFASIDHLKS